MSKSVEERLAALEEAVAKLDAFDQAATGALKQVAAHLKALVPLTPRVASLEQTFEDHYASETLARASRIYPKTRSVIFVARGYFGDNIKYAYLAFQEYARGKNIACHFLTDDHAQYDMLKAAGLPCLPCLPFKIDEWPVNELVALLAAKVVVLSDNFHPYSLQTPRAYGMLQGAKTVQLWHGIPIKQIGLGYVLRGDNKIPEGLLASSGTFDVFVAPGAAMREEWAEQFAFRDFAAIGYPRNDVFFRELTPADLLNVDRENYDLFRAAQGDRKPTVLYTPTYRDEAGLDWFEAIRISKLAEHCQKKGCLFAVNLHPYEQTRVGEWRARHPHIRFTIPGTDVYPIVKHTDVLVTDYSSLMFDFLLLDRPIVFYRADECITKQRGFIEGRINMTPGAVTAKPDELLAAMDAAVAAARDPKTDSFRAARQKLCRELYDHRDGDAGKRLCAAIEKLLTA
jgi:CDP-glycerol glycerophosphotransferase